MISVSVCLFLVSSFCFDGCAVLVLRIQFRGFGVLFSFFPVFLFSALSLCLPGSDFDFAFAYPVYVTLVGFARMFPHPWFSLPVEILRERWI